MPGASERERSHASRVLVVLTAVYVLNYLDRQILSILAEDVKRDLALTDAQIGFLYGTAFAVFYAVFGLPLGRLADTATRTLVVTGGLALWSAMTAVSGLARSFAQLAAARFGVGVGEASANPAAFSLIADYYPPERRATEPGDGRPRHGDAGGIRMGPRRARLPRRRRAPRRRGRSPQGRPGARRGRAGRRVLGGACDRSAARRSPPQGGQAMLPSLMRLDAVRIATGNLTDAVQAYGRLLGVEPVEVGDGRRFQLEKGAVELVAGTSGIAAVVFAPEDDGCPVDDLAFNGLTVCVETPPRVVPKPIAPDAVVAIDHVVAFTPDPARAIALWRDRLGLRLAFDREFPERKLRLLFFRSGGLTFEFASALPAPEDASGPDRFYGVSYRVRDLALRRATLLAAGFDVSEIRAGNKAGTRVASVRSGTEGVPTLLLEDEARHG